MAMEAMAKQAMAEEKLRRERSARNSRCECGEIVAAIARTNVHGLQVALKMMPRAVCCSLRGLAETDDQEDGLGRVAAWAHGGARTPPRARRSLSAGPGGTAKAPPFMRRLPLRLSALDRNGGDRHDCSQRVDHTVLSVITQETAPQVDTLTPPRHGYG